MNLIMKFSLPLKAFAAMLFAGIIVLYMFSSIIYTIITGEEINYSIPFVFIIQGLVLSVFISLLWGLFFSNIIHKKWRFFTRFILFELSLLVLLAVCFFIFLSIPANLTKLWLIAIGAVSLFVTVLFGIYEMYYKKTGSRYTEILHTYKSNNL